MPSPGKCESETEDSGLAVALAGAKTRSPKKRTPKKCSPQKRSSKILATFLFAFIFFPAARSAQPNENEKQLSIYSSVAVYTLPVIDRAGHEYVGLLELLEPLGRVSTHVEGQHLKLRFNAVDAEFVAGKTRSKIHGRDFDLAAPFLIEDSRGLVSLNSLGIFLPRFLGTPVTFRDQARRLFVGDVGIQISFRMEVATPPRLALNFTAPVNPTIST
jgi:hypothetical protein